MQTLKKAIAAFNRRRTIRRTDRVIDAWCRTNGMELNGNYGFTIRPAGLVREFNYLLRHYSEGRVEDFDDTAFLALVGERADIVARALGDRADPREHQNMHVGLTTAQRNIDCLVAILDTIAEYTVVCANHGRDDRVMAGRHYGLTQA